MNNNFAIKYLDEYLEMENSDSPNEPKRQKFIKKHSSYIPEKFYYYSPFSKAHHIKSLIRSQLWFSYPNNFNDPNDSKILIDASDILASQKYKTLFSYKDSHFTTEVKQIVAKELSRLNENIDYFKKVQGVHDYMKFRDNTNLCNRYRIGILSKYVYSQKHVLLEIDNMINNKKPCSEIKEKYLFYLQLLSETQLAIKDKDIAICCFSSINDDILMWTHYAEQHTGICLEFSRDQIHNQLGFIFPIIYDKPLHYFALMKDKEDLSSITDFLLKKFLYKTSNWAYECEWRALLSTQDYCKVFHENITGFLSPVLKPQAIYLGHAIREDDKEFIQSFCKEKGIPLYKMNIAKDQYTFQSPPQKL